MKNTKSIRLRNALIILAAICLCFAAIVVYQLIREQYFVRYQADALAKLERDIGEYDEQSIVLQSTSKARANELAERFGAVLRITENGEYARLTLPEGVTIRDVYADRENLHYLEEMSADYKARISDLTSVEGTGLRLPTRPNYSATDSDYAKQTYLDFINMSYAWNSNLGLGVTVAVIDTGIDTDHPEFAGRISEYSYNATEDKIVKDWLTPNGEYDWSLVEDLQGHGTAVTGVLAANLNSDSIIGIAPCVTIITIKAECDENGTFERTSDLVFGLYYAIERDVHVVNMSFGIYSPSNPFAEATQLAYDSDIICVAAAGNDATTALAYPAADPNVIGVGAIDSNWALAGYSNYGENSDVVAPGTTYTTKIGGGCTTMTGTSLSSPIVAGAIALYRQNEVYTTFDDVTELLYASCYDLGQLGNDWYYGCGALDVSAFLLEERGTVTFDMLTDEVENMDALFIRGHALQELPEPERLYAVFDGWYYDDTFTEPVEYYSDKFVSDLTLYAKWVNEDDGVPYTYVILDDGTVEIRSYTGHRRYITIPDKIDGRVISSIGDFAFSGQDRLREVKLPSGLTNIGIYAFKGCSNLLNIEIPEGVISIGDYAFVQNTRLASVAFLGNSKLTTIGQGAFSYSSHLERIELPETLSSVDGSAFAGDIALYSITVQRGNEHFKSVDGVLFNISGNTIVAYPAAHGNTYDIPEGVRYIGKYAFAYSSLSSIGLDGVTNIGESAFSYTALTSVTIPDSVVSMSKNAFAYASSLSELNIGRGLTAIPEKAFLNTFSLTHVTIPKGIIGIGMSAFSYLALQSVTFEAGSELSVIGDYAFAYCYISEIDIPASVVSIGEGAFAWDEDSKWSNPLSRVGFIENGALEYIGKSAFAYSPYLTSVDLPSNLKTIDDLAFCDTGLTAVSVPASVTTLGDGAFACCVNLTTIDIEVGNRVYHDIDGVVYDLENKSLYQYPAGREEFEYLVEDTTETIMPWAFAGTAYVNTAILPEGLVQISEYAFAYSTSMQYISIPDNVLQIGRFAFAETPQLYSITFTENAKLPRISYRAFAYSSLSSFTVPASVSTIAQGAFEGCSAMYSVTFAYGSKLESISAYMFDGCVNLQSITFLGSSSLKSIQAHGLEGMDNLFYIDFADAKITNIDNFAFRFCESLTYLNLPDTVTNIGRYAFYGCKSLSEITIPKNVEHIGSYAFLGTNEINVYFASDTLPAYLDENWDYDTRGYYVGVTDVRVSGDFEYAILTSGDIAILKYNGSDTHVDLTALNFGAPITAIGGSAFKDSVVVSIVLPNTLTSIQAEAFMYSALTSVTIPSSVTFIGREAFAHTDIVALTFAPTSAINVIEQYAFEGCKSLESVTLPASLTTMGTGAFMQSGLKTLIFESGIKLTEIPQRAFAETKLTTVSLPDSVTLVNHNAFNGVRTLKSISFGSNDGIRLMSNAFYHTGLTSLHIPANVTYIGEYCFVALTDLKTITVDSENPNYTSVDGLLLTKNGRKLIVVPAGRTGSLTVPLSVEEIGFGAFEESHLSAVLFHENANILTFGYRAFFKANYITEITVPASVVSIDYYAFGYCENLKTVIFVDGNNLKGIYEGAFIGNVNLENIVIPDTIVEISDFAFYGCTKITKLPISDSSAVRGIYDYAFAYTGISGEFTTPETLADIGDYAFLGTKVTKVIVPDTNKKQLVIGIGAFEDCDRLAEITLPFIGASYEDDVISWFGYIFGAGSATANEAYVPESLKTVTITEGITTIYPHAFSSCPSIETINLPHSISVVWYSAFNFTPAIHQFTNEITVKFPSDGYDCIGSKTIGSGTSGNLVLAENNTVEVQLLSMPYLQSVTVPEGITSVNFMYCTALKTVNLPSTITVIDAMAFYRCSGLVEITLPSSLTEIGPEAFYECYSLVKVVNNSSLELELGSESNGYVARYAKELVNKDGSSVRVNEFEYIETSDGFRFTKENGVYKLIAYMGDSYTVTLPDDIMGCDYELYRFTGASHVIIPEGVTEINAYAFYESSIVEVTLPDSLVSIGDWAFNACQALREVDLPYGLESIGNAAFRSCTSLTEVTVPDTVTDLGGAAFYSCLKLLKATLPDGITELNATFGYCYSLEYVEIPESVVILHRTFEECYALNNITIPDGVTRIGDSTFAHCTSLDSLVLPKGLEYLDGTALSYNTDVIFEGNENFKMIDGIMYNSDVTQIVYVTKNVAANVVIPDTVTIISNNAFEGRDGLVGIVLPNGMTEIPFQLFRNCTNLTSVKIPDSVEQIMLGAFDGCSALEHIELPSGLKRIEGAAFNYCTSLKSIELPDGIEYIGNSAFANTGIISIVIPDTVTNLGPAALYECKSLVSVTLPDGMTTIPYGLVCYCGSLTDIKIPDTVVSIEGWAFRGCSSLTSITIPQGVTSIGDIAFEGCYNLFEVVNNSSIELEFGSNDNGGVARYAKAITDRSGNVTYLDPENKFTYIDTPDGFRFIYDGQYKLIAYLGSDETITLPESINGSSYELYCFRGGVNVIIPDGVEKIPYSAFAYNNTIKSVTLPDSVVNIAQEAFYMCSALESITIPENVEIIEHNVFGRCSRLTDIRILSRKAQLWSSVFGGTAYANEQSNWRDGMLVIDGYLIDVDENLRYLTNVEGIIAVAQDAYQNCYYLKNPVFDSYEAAEYATNADTYIITDVRSIEWWEAIRNTLTLKNVIILDTVGASDLRYCEQLFTYWNVTGVTIYVEAYENDLRWNDNFPGWNNGNVVVYDGNWIYADFYDQNGNLLSHAPKRTSEIIRQPIINPKDDVMYDYEFIGWDIDGDGDVDSLPATSIVNISACPVISSELRRYTVTFKDAQTGAVYYTAELEYGSTITPPTDPTKEGTTFDGWRGYTAGMTVTGDVVITAKWQQHDLVHHDGKAPTCTEGGWSPYVTCTKCDYTTYEALGELGHDITEHDGKAPTCTEGGWNAYETCSRCDYTTYEKLGELGHNIVEHNGKAPTCTESGYAECFLCTLCEQYFVDEECERVISDLELWRMLEGYLSPTNDHAPAESVNENVVQSSCTAYGSYESVAYCTVCGAEVERRYELILPEGHSYADEITVDTPPTCTTNGMSSRHCTKCDERTDETIIFATGHSFGDWQTISPASCTDNGSEKRTCLVCFETEENILFAFGHTPVDSTDVERKEPTCEKTGVLITPIICDTCGTELERRSETLLATGHTLAEGWTIGIPATCTSEGIKYRTCLTCGAHCDNTVVQATPHSFTNYVSNGDATCDTDGTKTAKCDMCESRDTQIDVGSARGHHWRDATYDSPKICIYCNATEGEPLRRPEEVTTIKPEEETSETLPSATDDFQMVDAETDGCSSTLSHVGWIILLLPAAAGLALKKKKERV